MIIKRDNGQTSFFEGSLLCVITIVVIFSVFNITHAEQTIEIVTQRGNVFVLNFPDIADGSEHKEDAIPTINGLGLNSRMIHKEYSGSMIQGSNRDTIQGKEESIKPYIQLADDVRFVASFLDGDITQEIIIPELYHTYMYINNDLTKTSKDPTNRLGYEDTRRTWGDITVSTEDSVMISGTGRIILKLLPYNEERLILTGVLDDNTIARLVQSPYDLMNIQHTPNLGFLINYCNCDPGSDILDVKAGTVHDSIKSGTFQYDQKTSVTWYHGTCCTNKYTTRAINHQDIAQVDLIIGASSPANLDGYYVVTGDATTPQLADIEDQRPLGAKIYWVNYNYVTNFDHRIYDTLPVKEVYTTLTDAFEYDITMPSDTYLVVDSTSGGDKHSTIKSTVLAQRNLLEITDLPPNTGYRITRGDHTLSVGVTSDIGKIIILAPQSSIDNTHTTNGIGGKLYLYEDSMIHISKDVSTTTTGTLIFDHVNHHITQTDTKQNKAYNVHAYVKIPIIGQVDIANVTMDGTLLLPYLDGVYTNKETILVPVIPGYKTISLTINTIPVSLDIADTLGGTGLDIADSVSHTVKVIKPDGFVDAVEATAGVVTYMIAPEEGNAKAHVRATISGTSQITNSREYTKEPPPPPPPAPRDPLTTWIQVYINGDLQMIEGTTKTRIFFSDVPQTDHSGGTTDTLAYHTAKFSYPKVTVLDTISVPVQAADFVEFYFWTNIRAEGSIPPVPAGFTELRRDGSASATAIIEYASINTSM